jgi:hypothetical protein
MIQDAPLTKFQIVNWRQIVIFAGGHFLITLVSSTRLAIAQKATAGTLAKADGVV